jgi:hypothetical protein
MDGERIRVRARRAEPARRALRARSQDGQAAVEYVGLVVLVAAIIAAIAALKVPVSVAHAVSCEVKQITQSACAQSPPPGSAGSALTATNLFTPGGGQPSEARMERILGSNRLIDACAGNGRTEVGADQGPSSQACKAQLAKLSPRDLSVLEIMAALFQLDHDWRPGTESKQQYFADLINIYTHDPGDAVIALSRNAQALQSGPILASEKIQSTPGDTWDAFLGSLCGGYNICLGGTTLSQAYQQSYHASAGLAKISTGVLIATGVAGALKDVASAGLKVVMAKVGTSESEQVEQTIEDLESQANKGGGGEGGGGSPPPGGGPPAPGEGPGDWVAKNEGMSDRARAYQDQVTGQPNAAGSFVYKVSADGQTADFDGYQDGKFIEAKGPGYAWAVKDGQFIPNYKGAQNLVDQAERQLRVAQGTPIEWDIAEPQTADAIKALFRRSGIRGITVRYVPPQG